MYRATTPDHTFRFKFQADTCAIIRVAYAQNGKLKFVKKYVNGVADSGMVLDGTDVIITLTQEETKMFSEGHAGVQIRAMNSAGKVVASGKFVVSVEGVYDDEIMEV